MKGMSSNMKILGLLMVALTFYAAISVIDQSIDPSSPLTFLAYVLMAIQLFLVIFWIIKMANEKL